MLATGAPHPFISLQSKAISSHTHSCFLFDVGLKIRKRFLLEFDSESRNGVLVRAFEAFPKLVYDDDDDNDDNSGFHPANENKKDDSPGIGSTATMSNAGSQKPYSRVSAGSFRKLKAQKLKVLMQRASLMKQKVKKHEDGQAVEDGYFDKFSSSDSKSDTTQRKKILPAFVSERLTPTASPTQDFGETIETRTGELMKSSNARVKYSENYMSDCGTVPDKSQRFVSRKAGAEDSAPAASSLLRGWGNVGHVDSLKSKSTNPLQKQKFPAENGFFSRKSFRDLGCSEFMIESLKGLFFLRPSHIQAMAFTPVMEGKSCIIADQSGSGKTMAYLVPVIQRLRLEELQGLSKSLSRSPQVLIMVPTAELASQVLNNCRSMSKFGVPFRSMAATGGFSQRTQLENLEQGTDVLIVTPGRFMFLVKEELLKLTNLKRIVLDEVDILFNDEDFEAALKSLMNSSPVGAQYLFVTATLPVAVYNKLIEIFPDCEVIMGPGMHRTSARLEEVIIDCSGETGTERTPDTAFMNKKSALLQLVEQSSVPKTIVFCNKIETCRKVENALKRFDRKGTSIQVLPFHSALAQEARVANMKEFMKSEPGEYSSILVCTDRASRGIDFTGVDHVILFDFPRDPSEYVRRVGRTARGAVGKGKAFILVVGKQLSLAQKIVERNRKGRPLHDVPSVY